MDIRSLILGQQDLTTVDVVIPEWRDAEGKPVALRVKTFTAGERDSYEREQLENAKKGTINIRASLVARAVVDENGNRVFSDADALELAKKNGVALNRLFEAVLETNKVDVEALEKN